MATLGTKDFPLDKMSHLSNKGPKTVRQAGQYSEVCYDTRGSCDYDPPADAMPPVAAYSFAERPATSDAGGKSSTSQVLQVLIEEYCNYEAMYIGLQP